MAPQSNAVLFTNKGRSGTEATMRAPEEIPAYFPLQSYLDSSFESPAAGPVGQAVSDQPTNTGFVQSTIKEKQSTGYAVGLAPWSEAPCAIQFLASGKGGNSNSLVLRPGEVMTPHGAPDTLAADNKINFSGIRYGLPFGWLGGGQVTLYVFKTPGSIPDWSTDRREILFHRFQTVIRESSNTPPNPNRVNWPTRFPWNAIYRGITGVPFVDQRNTPVLCIEPTRVLLRLNCPEVGLVNPNPFRVVWWGSDDLAIPVSTATTPSPPPAVPSVVTSAYWQNAWPLDATFAGVGQKPLVAIPPDFLKLAANTYGMSVECQVGNETANLTVDVLRYGRL